MFTATLKRIRVKDHLVLVCTQSKTFCIVPATSKTKKETFRELITKENFKEYLPGATTLDTAIKAYHSFYAPAKVRRAGGVLGFGLGEVLFKHQPLQDLPKNHTEVPKNKRNKPKRRAPVLF